MEHDVGRRTIDTLEAHCASGSEESPAVPHCRAVPAFLWYHSGDVTARIRYSGCHVGDVESQFRETSAFPKVVKHQW